MVTKICKTCNKRFNIPDAWVRKGEGSYCSRKCQHPIKKVTTRNGKCFVPLSDSIFAICDESDRHRVENFNWHLREGYNGVDYAASRIKGKTTLMHRHILGVKCFSVKIDHRDRNGLNNCRENLRKCSNTENSHNSVLSKRNTSGFKGVSLSKTSKRWVAQIRIFGKNHFLGSFSNKIDAANAYKEASVKHFKDFSPMRAT